MISPRRIALLLVVPALTLVLAYRFAVLYRQRAGFPARRPAAVSPEALGLPSEQIAIPSPSGPLPGWFIPARGGRPGPAVILVHGWESNRGRVLPNARFLNAVGIHALAFDVRGHGENPPEPLPISGAEFAADTRAAVDWLAARPEVTRIGVLGHSMGAVGAMLAAAGDPRIQALVSTAAPADPRHLTRQTFALAGLPIPRYLANPLAWLTARVYLRPRGHSVKGIDGRRAIARYPGPVLLIHGESDDVIPVAFYRRLERSARQGAPSRVETYVVPEGRHSFLYEDSGYRRVVARFLTTGLGGPIPAEAAGDIAARNPILRPDEPSAPIAALARLGRGGSAGDGPAAPRRRAWVPSSR